MTSQLFTIHATTCSNAVTYQSGAIGAASGAMFLASDLWSGHIHATAPESNTFLVPRGCDLKIWDASVYGLPATVTIMASADSGATYEPIKSYANLTATAASNSVYTVKHAARPVVIPSPDGQKKVRVVYLTQAGDAVGNVNADFTAEILESDVY
jgi:hypothetical protein